MKHLLLMSWVILSINVRQLVLLTSIFVSFLLTVSLKAVIGLSCPSVMTWVPRRKPHRRSGLATLPSVGAVPLVTPYYCRL